MGLSISTTPAEIAIETIPGSFTWHNKFAQLDINQKLPLINIRTEQPVVMIDQYQCFAEAGLKNNIDFAREQAQKGYQNLVKYIGREARNGDAMAKIGYHANIMIDIIKRESVTKHEFGLGSIPRSRPTVTVAGGTVRLDAEPRDGIGETNGITSRYTPGALNFNYTATKVDIRMVSYGSVNIKYTGNNVDGYI